MAAGDLEATDDVDRLLFKLTRFLLWHSAEGAFEVRDTVRQVAGACGVNAEILAIAEGAVLTVRHGDGPGDPQYTAAALTLGLIVGAVLPRP